MSSHGFIIFNIGYVLRICDFMWHLILEIKYRDKEKSLILK